MSRFIYLVFVVILAMKAVETGVPQKIPLTVYYESKCPDSKNFIIDQLRPALELLHHYFKLMLVPFGKARSIGDTHFECQHGPTECTGNMVQSCTLYIMKMGGASDRQLLDYVTCEMKTQAGTTGDDLCVKRAHVNEKMVASCLSSGMGIQLLLEHEYLTNLVQPKFIPTVTLNHIFNQQFQDSAMEDLQGTLCSVYKHLPPCARYYNEIARQQLL